MNEIPRGVILVLLLLIVVSPNSAVARNYFVKNSGDQTPQDGSEGRPFSTIQACIDRAMPGDTCFVDSGLYQEVLEIGGKKKERDGMKLIALAGAEVVVSNLKKPIGEWENLGNGVYRIKVGYDRIFGVFVNNRPLPLARTPDAASYFKPSYYRITDAKCKSMAGDKWTSDRSLCTPFDEDGRCSDNNPCWDSSFPKRLWKISSRDLPANLDWSGAIISVISNAGYSAERATIVSMTEGGELVFEYFSEKDVKAGFKFYISGSYAAMDSPSEWFFDSKEGYLYLRLGEGFSLEDVRVKTNDLLLSIRDSDNVYVGGIRFFGGRVEVLGESSGVVLDRIVVDYPVGFGMFGAKKNYPGQGANRYHLDSGSLGRGVTLGGSKNVIMNSSVKNSWCDGVSVFGEGNVVLNNNVSDVNWGMTACAAISMTGDSHVIRGNTLSECGRSCLWHQRIADADISYNDIKNACWLGKDCGVTGSYGWYGPGKAYEPDRDGDGRGNVFHHNWIHGNRNKEGGPCLYLDNDERGYLIHHNVLWDCKIAFSLNDSFLKNGPTGHSLYNNTCFDVEIRLSDFGASREWALTRVQFINNLCSTSKDFHYNKYNNASVVMSNNVGPGDPNIFEGVENLFRRWSPQKLGLKSVRANDFTLQKDAVAIDRGLRIDGITTPITGRGVDVGAYEFGVSWPRQVGYVAAP